MSGAPEVMIASQGFGEILFRPWGSSTMIRSRRDHHLGAAAHDAFRRHGNRLQAGRAEAIDVTADTSTGKPARSDAMRATFIPCSPSGMAQPRITSSISLGSSCGTRSSAPLIATAASSSDE